MTGTAIVSIVTGICRAVPHNHQLAGAVQRDVVVLFAVAIEDPLVGNGTGLGVVPSM